MKHEEEVWRWNVDDIWQSYSSMFQEEYFTVRSTNQIERYHHLTATLLFGSCAIEAFLNARMRIHRKKKGDEEKEILKFLRYTALRKKLEKWPLEFCGTLLPNEDIKIITEFYELRNEVTHRKKKDHSLYKALDDSNVSVFIDALQRILVTIYCGLKESFPYWLLGWNYVGMNGDETHPLLCSNQQFQHSLRRLGFDVPAWEYQEAVERERLNMTTPKGFEYLKLQVYFRCPDIEPRDDRFPQMPRLCKLWWDKNLIRA